MADNSNLIVAALQRTDPLLAQQIDADNSWRNAIKKRGARVKLYRDYERGDHRADITTEMKKMLRLKSDDADLSDFNDNYMRVIVDKMAGRLFVSNIATDKGAKNWLADMLAYQDFDAQQSDWYRGAIRDGDAFVMVDSNTLRWVSEPAYDGFDGMVVIFDTITRKALWACKLWSEADTSDIAGDRTTYNVVMKIVVYQPGGLSYWKGQESGTEIEPDNKVDDGTNIVFWPLDRLPIVPIMNQKDNFTSYGESELRPAIPLQDVLNRTMHSMVMASELSAFQRLWSKGMEVDVDGILPGAVINLVLKDSSGNIVTSPDDAQLEFMKSVEIGVLEGSDISQYTNQIDKVVQQISQSTQTPIYGVTAQGNLSGEALKQLEIGLLGKVERFQRQNTDAIRELVLLTAEMQRTFDNDAELPDAPIFEQVNVVWKSAEILDVNARIATLTTLREKAPGLLSDEFYIKRIGNHIGMSQAEINDEIEKAQTQQGFQFDLFTAANNEQAA